MSSRLSFPGNFNPEQPIPNNPFYSDPSLYSAGPWFPFIVGTGFTFDYQTSTINATGGGGGGTPATPTVLGSVLGCTVANWTALGCNALLANTAAGNTAIGVGAMCSNTTGINNTAVGFGALSSAVTSTCNIAIGFCALPNSVCRNFAIGAGAGLNLTTGGCNTLVGHRTGEDMTTGCFNLALGYRAMGNVTTGINNTAIGCFAGTSFTTECYNVLLGGFDGSRITGCNAHVVISDNDNLSITNVKVIWSENAAMDPGGTGNYGNPGDVLISCGTIGAPVWGPPGSGSSATPTVEGSVYGCTTLDNAILGQNAFAANTTGASNSALGANALQSSTTGCYNTAVGTVSLPDLTSGVFNVGIGYNVGSNLTTENGNLILGGIAGETGCNGNIFIGNGSGSVLGLRINNSGAWSPYNTGIGSLTPAYGTAGQVLVSCGPAAAPQWASAPAGASATPTVEGSVYGCTTGTEYNTSLGQNTLGTPSALAVANVATGYCSLGALTDGSSNTALGAGAGVSITTGGGNIAVGFQSLPSVTTGCCNIVIGNAGGTAYTTENFNVLIGANAGVAGDECTISLSDGQGTLRLKLNECGALSFNGTDYGTAGQVLCSGGPGNTWGWTSTPTITIPVATPTITGSVLGCTDNDNAALGCNALLVNTGALNTAIGPRSMSANTTGSYNTALGDSTLATLDTGNQNIAVGYTAGSSLTSESGNVIIGGVSGEVGVDSNVFIANGSGSVLGLRINDLGAWSPYNTGAGLNTPAYGTAGQVLVSCGNAAAPQWDDLPSGPAATPTTLGTVLGCTTSYGTALGCNAMLNVETTYDTYNTAIGHSAMCTNVDGDSNVAVGYQALLLLDGRSNNVAIGSQALCGGRLSNKNTAVGESAGRRLDTGDENVFIGRHSACVMTLGESNTAIGTESLRDMTSGNYNTVLGNCSGGCLITGNNNLILGIDYGAAIDGCDCNAIINAGGVKVHWNDVGAASFGGYNNFGTAGQFLISSGPTGAPVWGPPTTATPTSLGAVLGCTTANDTALGCNALLNRNTLYDTCNTAVGYNALYALNDQYATGNAAVGFCALASLTEGQCNVAIGFRALRSSTDGDCHVAIGLNSLRNHTNGNRNVAIGPSSACELITGDRNVFIGGTTATSLQDGCYNTVVGNSALENLVNGCYNTVIGYCSGENLNSGNFNVILGNYRGTIIDGCDRHVVISDGCTTDFGVKVVFNALGGMSFGASGDYGNSGDILTSSGGGVPTWTSPQGPATPAGEGLVYGCTTSYNTAIGRAAIYSTTTGTCNAAFGYESLKYNTTGSFNTALGDRSGFILNGGSGNVIVGSFNAAGTYAPVFDVNTEDNRVVIGSTAVTNAYVQVAWTVVSDARDKIVEGAVPHGLEFVKQLEPKAFHFKKDRNSSDPHGPLRYGFLAQDILALEGGSGVIIDSTDPDKLRYNGEALVPVLVKAIQELSTMNAELEYRVSTLESKP